MRKFTLLLLITSLITGNTLAQSLVSLLPAGTTANITTGYQGGKQYDLIVSGDKTNGYKAFFAAANSTNGLELWATDGTPEGTAMVKDISAGTAGSDVSYIGRFNNKVVFSANDGTNGTELWISDGTEVGTFMVKDLNTAGSSDPRGFTQINETQFVFAAKGTGYSGARAGWLYISDGTSDGTTLLSSDCGMIYPGAGHLSTSRMLPYCRVGRKVFFKADNSANTIGEELWVTDGTTEGTKLVKDIYATANGNGATLTQMVSFYNEKLFFGARSDDYGAEPWASDGTEAGTYMIKDTSPGTAAGGVTAAGSIYPYDGKIYYRGFSSDYGTELACTNLEKDDYKVFDININPPTSTNHSTPDPGVEFDGVYMFSAQAGGAIGATLFYTDGETVTMHSNVTGNNLNFFANELTVISGSLYMWNPSGAAGFATKLFRLDSKASAVERVTTINGEAADYVHSLRNLNGDALFASGNAVNNAALYVYSYRKATYDPLTDIDDYDRDLEFRTREEIGGTVDITYESKINNVHSYSINGVLYINVEKTKVVNIYALDGTLVRSFIANEGENTVHNLRKGLYLVNKQKVIIQ